MSKIRILFLIHDLKHGGAEKVLINLVNNMDYEKYEITVMTLFDVGINKQFLNSQIHYKTVFRKEFRGNKYFFRLFTPQYLYKHYITDQYDILVAYLEGSCTRIISGCENKNVMKVAWRHTASEGKKEYKQCYRSLREAHTTYAKYDCVVGVSKSVIDNFLELNTYPIERTRVIYNTNETENIKQLARESVGSIMFQCTEKKIIGVGRVHPRKGFMRLAHVHKKLWEEGYRYKIFVLGEGEERGKIEDYLKENKLQDSFIFLGYDTNPYKYVSKSDLFICPSFEEGFSTAATEALIVGTPVLTTLCAGMEEMLGENNEYGVIVENSETGIYEGLKKFLDHPELFEYYHEKALERRERFSTETTVRSVEDLIELLLNKVKK